MKHRIFFLSALAGLVTAAILLPLVASAVDWSTAVTLGSDGDKPAAAVDSNGHFYAVWQDTTANTIQYAECDDLAANTCNTPSSLPDTGKSSNPRIALDPQNRPNVVWQAKSGKTNAIYWSRLESDTWSTPIKISAAGNNTLPDIAVGVQGNIHVVYQSIQNKKGVVEYVLSSGGQHFGAAVAVDSTDVDTSASADAGEGNSADAVSRGFSPRVAADSADRPHIVWNAPAPFGVFYSYLNSANKFVNKIPVSTKSKEQFPAIAIGPGDLVGIVWTSKEKSTVGIAQFLNGARTYIGQDFPMGLKIASNPQIASDCWGSFQVVFQGVESGNKTQIYHRTFDPKTEVFDEQTQLSDPAQQVESPAIAAAGKGGIVFTNKTAGAIQASAATFVPDCNDPPAPTPTFTPPPGDEHIANDDPRIVYTGPWVINPDTHATDGDYLRCGGLQKCTKDWSADLTFVGGTRIEWETAAAKTFGKAQVTIDGQLFEQIDFCRLHPNSATLKFSKRTYILTGDSTTPHEIKITAMGEHSTCSPKNTNYVVVDGFNVIR